MNPYVVFDTSVLQTFLQHIKNAIGSSVTVGILIFACIMGVLVVISVVRRFSRT